MSKKADRLSKIEDSLEEIAQLLRLLLARGLNDAVPDVPAPVNPYIPPLTPVDPMRPWQPPTLPAVPDLDRGTTCPRCGMTFRGVTGYVCQDPTCPSGLGPITC